MTPLRKTDNGQVFGFEIKPKDGTPWHSGYVESESCAGAEEIILGAWKSGNIESLTKNEMNL